MDYEAEKSMELEALEAILMEDLSEYDGPVPGNWPDHEQIYKVQITTGEDGGPQDDPAVILELLFAHTPKYPDEAPCIKARSGKGLSDKDIQDAEAVLQAEIETNLGMAMIFQLVSVAREWLQAKGEADDEEDDPDLIRKRIEEAEEAKRAALRAHGTMVTIEAFKAWQAKFEAEMLLERAKLDPAKDPDKKDKISGKMYFLKEAMSEIGTEEGALSEDDEGDFADEDEDDEFEDLEDDDDDDDDDEMLEQYLASKK